MAIIKFKGNTLHTVGELPAIGSMAPAFALTKTDLAEIQLSSFSGKTVILNIFPSLDTPVCGLSVKKFNTEADKLDNTIVLCISMDLPFAQSRFCGAEGLNNVVPVSAFRHPEFAQVYGVKISDGPLSGLLSRAVLIIDKEGKVIYTEQVAEMTNEPNYSAAMAVLM